MAISILMPALSPTMEEGTLAKWHVKEGDKIVSGDVLAEIETDKATMEYEAVDEGTIGKIVVAEGTEGVLVNAPIAYLLEDGEDASAIDTSAADMSATDTGAADKGTAAAPPVQADVAATSTQKPASAPAQAAPISSSGTGARVFASPLARRLAQERGIDLVSIKGSGPHGRIIKRDIEAGSSQARRAGAVSGGPAVPALDVTGVYALYEADQYDALEVDKMRGVIAERLTQSKRDIPHYYVSIDCDIDALLEARKQLNEDLDDGKISVNDFVIKACALALMRFPDVNASWAGTHILRHKHADIAMAVAIEGGLITPIIRSAETLGLTEISVQAKDLAGRARSKKLAPNEFQGGSFSISNLGMFGVKHFTAVINPPQAAILAVGGGEARAIVRADGTIGAATIMTVTMSCDHRVVDGALAAQFLAEFKRLIEAPVRMLR